MRKIIAYILYLLRKNLYSAKILGVSFGKDCKFIGNPITTFGSEPWAITIGNHVEITYGVQLITHDGALWVLREKKEYNNIDIINKINIGNNVFIGTNCILLGGITIGNNVIIGAGTIVNKNIPDNTVAAGNPVRIIKTINEYEEKIKKLSYKNTKGMSSNKKKEILVGK